MSQPDALSLEGTVVAVAADRGHRFSKPTRDRIVLLEGHGVERRRTNVKTARASRAATARAHAA